MELSVTFTSGVFWYVCEVGLVRRKDSNVDLKKKINKRTKPVRRREKKYQDTAKCLVIGIKQGKSETVFTIEAQRIYERSEG